MIHIIGDTHLYHDNIIKYCDRPLDYNERIIKNLTELRTDLLIHLGDVVLSKRTEEVHDMIAQLPYNKVLLLGNHDKKTDTWYLQHGWNAVFHSVEMYVYGKWVKMTHRPLGAKPRGMSINLCGHIHNNPDVQLPSWCKAFIIENEDYKPVPLQEFIERR